jgi:hypothetical protein
MESFLEENKWVLFSIPFIIGVFSLITIHDFRNNGMKSYDDLEAVSKLIQEHEIKQITVDDDFYFVMLKYHFGEKLNVFYSKKCKGYFLSSKKQKEGIGETEFTTLQYCEE